jgi:C1A family cysteine protease
MTERFYGCIRDTRDARDYMFAPSLEAIPAVVDLRKNCPPVMDQGELGSCTAHGITGALRCARITAGMTDIEFARLQLYFDERDMEGTIESDGGGMIRDGIKCAAKIGVAQETLWPYDISKFTVTPPPEVYSDAIKHQSLQYERVQVDASHIKTAIAHGFPVVIGVTLFDSFESEEVAATGMVPIPNTGVESPVGGHCLYAVGYGQKDGCITVRNSWNTTWGDKGDCYFPDHYLGSTLFGSDYWTITKVE